jgi:Skp family chaperone for outer membrane proteins
MSTGETEPKKSKLTLEQMLATVAVVLFILGAFLAAIFLYRQQQQLDQLARQVIELHTRLAQAGTTAQPAVQPKLQRLAYVNTSQVAARYAQLDTQLQGDLQAKQVELQKELDGFKQQLKDKQITQDQFDAKVRSIQDALNQLKQQAYGRVAGKLITVIDQIGREGNYDLITGEENVILYSRSGLMEDLSNEVLARLQAQLAPAH